MSDDISVISLPEGTPEVLTIEEATAALMDQMKKPQKESPAESAEPATAETELADEANAAPDEGTTAEDSGDEPEVPAIDPPRSWSKDAHERWSKLDPETQKFLADRDSEDQKAIKRALNEAADVRKAGEAERAKAEQARQQYEAKLTSTVKIMEDALQADFGDIQSLPDVRKLQAEDPFRFQAWQVRQMELTAAKSEQLVAEQRQAQEKQSKRAGYEAQENARLIELVPEMADPKKASELRERAISMLTDDLGLKTDLLTRWMQDDTGHEILSNAGIQKLIADGLKYRDIKSAPKAVVKADLPPVQRPGTSKPAGTTDSARIQALEKQFERTGSLDDAFALRQARERRRA